MIPEQEQRQEEKRTELQRIFAERQAMLEELYPGLLDELATLTGKSPEHLNRAIVYTSSEIANLYLDKHTLIQ